MCINKENNLHRHVLQELQTNAEKTAHNLEHLQNSGVAVSNDVKDRIKKSLEFIDKRVALLRDPRQFGLHVNFNQEAAKKFLGDVGCKAKSKKCTFENRDGEFLAKLFGTYKCPKSNIYSTELCWLEKEAKSCEDNILRIGKELIDDTERLSDDIRLIQELQATGKKEATGKQSLKAQVARCFGSACMPMD